MEEPDGPKQIVITVVKSDDASKAGTGDMVVKGYSLKIITPQDEGEIHYITAKPEMPVIPCEAKFSGYNGGENPVANWECKVKYDYPPGSDEAIFTKEILFNSEGISEWNLNFNNSATIIGGKAALKVKTTIENQLFQDSTIFYIRGENPDNGEVINKLDAGQIALLKTEVPNYSQFDTEDYAEPNEGLPLRGFDGHGWGLCQLDDRSHAISTGTLWDWTVNRTEGLNYYNEQRDVARARLERIGHLDTPADGQTRQSMIDIEAYARYNGGPSARYWRWIIPDPNEPNNNGHWIVDPTWWRSGERVPAPHLRENVNHYIRNY